MQLGLWALGLAVGAAPPPGRRGRGHQNGTVCIPRALCCAVMRRAACVYYHDGVPHADTLPRTTQLLVLQRSMPDGVKRAARLLAEVVRRASLLCAGAAQAAMHEAVLRLKANGLVEEQEGRVVLLDTQIDVRMDLCMLYCCVATAAPGAQDARGSMPLLRGLCQCLRSGVEWQAVVAMQALGHAHEANLPALVPELSETLREAALGGGKLRGKTRREDVRLYVAHIWRQVGGACVCVYRAYFLLCCRMCGCVC